MTPDEKFAAALSEITDKRIDPPPACICDPYGFQGNSNCPACNPEFSTSGFETREDSPDEIAREAREEKHQKDSIAAHEEAYYTVMRNMYLTAQAESQQAEIRALHEVMRAIHTAMSKYEDDNLSGYTVVAPPTSGH